MRETLCEELYLCDALYRDASNMETPKILPRYFQDTGHHHSDARPRRLCPRFNEPSCIWGVSWPVSWKYLGSMFRGECGTDTYVGVQGGPLYLELERMRCAAKALFTEGCTRFTRERERETQVW